MVVDLQKLNLTLEQLLDIRNTLYQKILQGLAVHGQEIKALPAYLRRPSNTLPGEAVVLDVGGTNIRAARLWCQGSNAALLTNPVADRETMQQAKTPGQVNARQFFATQAALIAQVCSESTIKLGYCFSYPTEIKPDGDALLLKWAKGHEVCRPQGEGGGDHIPLIDLCDRGRRLLLLLLLHHPFLIQTTSVDF
jgi:hexokinase